MSGGVLGILILVAIGLLLIFFYNRLVKLRNNTENAFSDVDVQLKARFNLVGNLVETVKGYASHEKELLENVTEARSIYNNADGIQDKVNADNMLTGALKSLFAVSENYPDLKANQNFMHLQQELSDIENKIAASRRYYNASVKEYDNAREIFPSNIIANMFTFEEVPYFEIADENEKKNPQVKF